MKLKISYNIYMKLLFYKGGDFLTVYYSQRRTVNFRNNILFSALGGAQNFGSSCYFLQLGDANILLDCGTSYYNGISYLPKIDSLVDSQIIDSYDSISEVFISHAHMDHIGGLRNFMTATYSPDVYMTSVTAKLYKLQSLSHSADYNFFSDIFSKRCREVSFREKIDFESYSVTFFPAGHILGAMMCLFEYNGRKILYTGDYSLNSAIVQGCNVRFSDIDTLILCGLHSKHSGLVFQNNISMFMRNIGSILFKGCSVWIQTKCFNKSIEVLAFITMYLPYNGLKIYVKDSILNMISEIENMGFKICDSRSVPLSMLDSLNASQHIVVSDDRCKDRRYVSIEDDFTLHDTFDEMLRFIKELRPNNTVIVHSSPFRNYNDCSVADILVRDAEFDGRFYFPDEKELLIL